MRFLAICQGCRDPWLVETRADLIAFSTHIELCERNLPSSSDEAPRAAGTPGDGGAPRPASGTVAPCSRLSGDMSPTPVYSSPVHPANLLVGPVGSTPNALIEYNALRLVAEVETHLRRAAR